MKLFDKVDGFGKFKAFLTMLGVLILSLLIVYIPFIIRGNALVWVEMARDAMTQGVTYLEHVKNNGYLSSIGNFDYWIGLGADYMTSLSFFSLFDPFNLLYFILPFSPLTSYSITMAFKSLACGIIFYLFIKNKKVTTSRSIMLALMYMLTGFVCFTFVRHYNLTAGPIYFPLIIMGLERSYDGKRPYMLIISVFLCLITNFYVFFSATVLSVIYILIRHFVFVNQGKTQKGFKVFVGKFSYLALIYLLGTLLACFMLIPNFVGYMNAARSASKGYPIFQPHVFLANLATFIFPVQAPRYGHMYLNIAVLIMGICAVFTKIKETKPYRIIVVVLTIGFFLPLFGYAMNIFNYCNNRWSYSLSFFIFVLIGLNSKAEEQPYTQAKVRKINATLICYLGLILVAGVLSLVALLGYSWHLIWGILLCALVVLGAIFLLKKGIGLELFKKYYKQSILFPMATILSLCYCLGYYCFYSAGFDSKPVYEFLHTEEEAFVAEQNKYEFFRTDAEYNTSWFDSFDNRPVNNGYMGTHSYNSISNKFVYEFLKENGVYNPPQNLGMFGFNGRSALQSLTSVKYTYSNNGHYYNYKKVDGYQDLYENNYYNSFGFVFTNTISREKYLSLDVLERQFALMQGVVIEGVEGTMDNSISNNRFTTVYKEYDTEIKDGVKYEITNPSGKEIYLAVEGVKEVDSLTKVKFTCGSVEKEYSFYQKGNLMYTDVRDFYINFAVPSYDSDDLTISVEVLEGKGLVADSVKVITVNEGELINLLNSVKSNDRLMSGVKYNSNGIKGYITVENKGYLFLSIPYSEGWEVFVDNVQEELHRADTAFMAVEIDKGYHVVELRYKTPYFEMGKALSLGALILTFATCIGYEIIKFRTKKQK